MSSFAAVADIPTDLLVLLGGFCLILLLGCIFFVIIALVMKKKAEHHSAEVKRLQSLVADMKAQEAKPIEPEELVQDSDTADELDLTVQLNEAEERFAAAQEKLNLTEAQLNITQDKVREVLDALRSAEDANEELQRQLVDANDRVEASGNGLMNELIVNFTAESREMMSSVEALETENNELKQMIQDMESSEKGTTGTIVGLKRKLQQAEEKIQLLQEEAAALRRQPSPKPAPRAS